MAFLTPRPELFSLITTDHDPKPVNQKPPVSPASITMKSPLQLIKEALLDAKETKSPWGTLDANEIRSCLAHFYPEDVPDQVPGPLHVTAPGFTDEPALNSNGSTVLSRGLGNGPMAFRNAQRLAACWNACHGLDLPPDIPAGAVTDLVAAARRIAQRWEDRSLPLGEDMSTLAAALAPFTAGYVASVSPEVAKLRQLISDLSANLDTGDYPENGDLDLVERVEEALAPFTGNAAPQDYPEPEKYVLGHYADNNLIDDTDSEGVRWMTVKLIRDQDEGDHWETPEGTCYDLDEIDQWQPLPKARA